MRRPESSDGFLMCFLLNLLWEAGWGIAAAVLLILRFTAGAPNAWWRWMLAAWLTIAFVKTALIEWVGDVSSRRDPEKPNRNPYSVRSAKPPEEAEKDETEFQLDSAPAHLDLEKLNAALDELKDQSGELAPEDARGQTM